MTKKEISAMFDNFIQAHNPDEFQSLYNAVYSFWRGVYQTGSGLVNKNTHSSFNYRVGRWWWADKHPLSEGSVLSSMDTGYVTHKYINIHACYVEGQEKRWWNNCVSKPDVVDILFDLSFKYNIIGVEQKPGNLRVWVKESEDHQTNITGEVIEKIAKCLEF